jgi:hypothetical protein
MNGVDVLATHAFQWGIYDWNVAFANADYNGDGNADLLLLNNVTHQWQAVLMFGVHNGATRTYDLASGWEVVPTKSDFNGDGRDDVLLRNDVLGKAEIVEMNGVDVAASQQLSLGPDWTLASLLFETTPPA